jgi:5-keto 4-deoxyuronate isomerase
MAARKLRDIFVIDDLFRPGEISMIYVEVDRGCDSQDSQKLAKAVPEDATELEVDALEWW